MAQSIEAYIVANQKDVTSWLVKLFSEYILVCYKTDKPEAQYVISSRFCSDSRRISKALEVLRHYNLITNQRYVPSLTNDEGGYYDVLVNREAFLEMAPEYGVPHPFEFKVPYSSDRVEGYPILRHLSCEGVIHYYFNQDLYGTYENPEYYTNAYGTRVKSSGKDIRVYPKNLEAGAEKVLFESKVMSYYGVHLEDAIEVLYGFTPEVLTSGHEKTAHIKDKDVEDTLKNMPVTRCNGIYRLDSVNKEDIEAKLENAKRLKLYAEACIRDLTKLSEVVPDNGYTFINDLIREATPVLLERAPLMMSDPDTKELASMLLRGSDKGLI